MKSAEDIESYLLKMGLPYEQIEPGMWNIKADGTRTWWSPSPGRWSCSGLKVMDLPHGNRGGAVRDAAAPEHHRDGPRRVRHRGRHGGHRPRAGAREPGLQRVPGGRSTTCRMAVEQTLPRTFQVPAAPAGASARRSKDNDTWESFRASARSSNRTSTTSSRKAEDPQKMLNQIVLDMQNQLVEAKKQVAVAIADEKRLQKQLGRADRDGQGVGAQGDAGGARRRRRPRQGGAAPQAGARQPGRPSSASSGSCRSRRSTS